MHDDDDFPEQFSPQSREALDRSVDVLVDALRRHAALLGGLRGGSSDIPVVFAANEEVARLVAAWNERVLDHTGTSPVELQGFHGDDEDEDEPEPVDVLDGQPLSVVSRWDLLVVDADALVQAGRATHQRLRPDETDRDAAVAVPSAEYAVSALLHEHGEPWYEMPGVEVLSGRRVFVRPRDVPTPLLGDVESLEDPITQPPGERLYGEDWV